MLSENELEEMNTRISANADRLIDKRQKSLYCFVEGKSGRKPSSFANCVQPETLEVFRDGEEQWPLWIDDVLSGIARLDWYRPTERSIPLSAKNILKCFALLDTINASLISHLLNVEKRLAQYYFKACELAHQRLIDGYCTDDVQSTKYPETFIYYKRELIPLTDIEF